MPHKPFPNVTRRVPARQNAFFSISDCAFCISVKNDFFWAPDKTFSGTALILARACARMSASGRKQRRKVAPGVLQSPEAHNPGKLSCTRRERRIPFFSEHVRGTPYLEIFIIFARQNCVCTISASCSRLHVVLLCFDSRWVLTTRNPANMQNSAPRCHFCLWAKGSAVAVWVSVGECG